MIMENVMVSNAVSVRAREVVSDLLGNRSVNLASEREPLNEFNAEVFEEVERLMERNNPDLEYGCSHSDGRFWLVD